MPISRCAVRTEPLSHGFLNLKREVRTLILIIQETLRI